MPIVNLPVSSLINGVSQQAASVRAVSQLAAQDNAWSSLVDGLTKRAPFKHVAKLTASTVADAFVHDINRDTAERYVVILEDGALAVYDAITGATKSLSTPNGSTYLACTTPSEELSAITVADYTFVVNRTVQAAMLALAQSTVVTITIASPGVVTHVAHGYSVDTPITLATTGALPTGLAVATTYYVTAATVDAYSLSATVGGAAINTSGTQSGVHTLTMSTGKYVKYVVQDFAGLPGSPAFNEIVKITGSPTNPFDNFWVQWNGSVWVEAVKPALQNSYDPATMPHVLIRNSDGTWTFKQATWDSRLVSDEYNAPTGAFVGRTIAEVLFHRNRLGLASDESVVFSRASGFFNFFRSTATQILDTDPVHAAVSHSKVSEIRHAIPFDKQLLLFADQTQFSLTAKDALTPTTSSIGVTTEFEASKLCRPVAAGSSLYFPTVRGGGACIREYFVQKDTLTNDAADITAHVPTYIPSDVYKMAASSTQDCVLVLTKSQRNVIYVYQFYWRGDEKVQSAWSKWTLASTDTILSAYLVGSVIHAVIQRADGIFLETANVQQGATDTDVGFLVHLDRRTSLTGVYNAATAALYAGTATAGGVSTITLAAGASAVDDFYNNTLLTLTAGTGSGQALYVLDYDGTTKVATVATPWATQPDGTTEYSMDDPNDITTWTLPYVESADMQVVLSGDFAGQEGSPLTIARPTTTTITATGDYSAGEVYVGVKYSSRSRLSEPFVRADDTQPILDGRVQLKRLLLRYTNSGSFHIEVTPQGRETYDYVWNGKRLGDASLLIGSPTLAGGTFQVPIMSRSDRVVVELVNDSYLPSAFQSAEWVAEFTPKSKRV